MGRDLNKFFKYKNRLEQGYGLSRAEQTEWGLLAKEWMKLYLELDNTRMYQQVVRILKTYGNGSKPRRKRTTIEEDHMEIANEVLR